MKIGIFGMIWQVFKGATSYVFKNILLMLNKTANSPIVDKISNNALSTVKPWLLDKSVNAPKSQIF